MTMFMKLASQLSGGALALLVTGAIHYHLHSLTAINTFGHALVVSFSFWPGMFLGYLAMKVVRFSGLNESPPSVASAICAFFWFIYLFRAITLLVKMPQLSNWTEGPVFWLVYFFDLFV